MNKKEINEQIELARQSGYNEACYIFEKKVEKLKEVCQTMPTLLENIDKIFGSFNSPQDCSCKKFEPIAKTNDIVKTPYGVDFVRLKGKPAKDICANCGHFKKDHYVDEKLIPYECKLCSCKKFKPIAKTNNIVKEKRLYNQLKEAKEKTYNEVSHDVLEKELNKSVLREKKGSFQKEIEEDNKRMNELYPESPKCKEVRG